MSEDSSSNEHRRDTDPSPDVLRRLGKTALTATGIKAPRDTYSSLTDLSPEEILDLLRQNAEITREPSADDQPETS